MADPEVEMFVAAPTRLGMSGGGVFNRYGRLIGIMTRAGTSKDGAMPFVRVVRMSMVHGSLAKAYAGSDIITRERVLPFLSKELAGR